MSSEMNINQIATRPSHDIDIVDAENRSLVKINNVEDSWYETHISDVDGDLNSESIAQLNHWLGTLPSAATAMTGNSSKLMTCSFEFSQLMQAKDGNGSIGAVLKPGTNKIGAQARFKEANELKSIVNANLVFNLASQLLAQKHLADINERLQVIEQKVDSIQKYLKDSRFTKIQAIWEHLQIISQLLSGGDQITKDTLQNLAKTAQELRAEVIHINKDITDAYAEIEHFDPKSFFGSNDLRKKLKQQLTNIENLQRQYMVGMQCLLMANLILYIKHGGNKEFILSSELYLNELRQNNGVLPEWGKNKRTIYSHLSKMKPLFERAISSQANALQVELKLKQVDSLLHIDTDQISLLNERIHAAQSPQILLEIVEGKVQRGYYLR